LARTARGFYYFVAMTSLNDPITPSFTGKELDRLNPNATVDGNGLSYFGARYYDADIGMWTSVILL